MFTASQVLTVLENQNWYVSAAASVMVTVTSVFAAGGVQVG